MRWILTSLFIFFVGCTSAMIPFSKEDPLTAPEDKQIQFYLQDLEQGCRDYQGPGDLITPQQRICETSKLSTFAMRSDEEGLIPIPFENGVLIPPKVIAGAALNDFQQNVILIHNKSISFKEAIVNLLAVKMNDLYRIEFKNNWIYITVESLRVTEDNLFSKSISDLGFALKREHDPDKKNLIQVAILSKYADVSFKFDRENTLSAKEISEHLLTEAIKNKKAWWYGKVIFEANTVLGKLALMNNNLQEANRRLLKSVDLDRNSLFALSPYRNTQLAKPLLERKQKKTVQQFLRKLRTLRLPRTDVDDIKFWEDELKKSGITQFKPIYER
ncbi:MAG: hypothetical protein K2Q26_14685 [Bdellovibrionales bacterium]|nr:hypothetical protein [Bdellovibrionales bacterium]